MNVKDLGNRVVLITSAGSGIGRQTALLRARRRRPPDCAALRVASIGSGRGAR